MQTLSLRNISIEIPSVVGGGDPDPFHQDAVWSIYDRHGNLFGNAHSSNLLTLNQAIERAIAIATTDYCHQVTIRWEGESLEEVAPAGARLNTLLKSFQSLEIVD